MKFSILCFILLISCSGEKKYQTWYVSGPIQTLATPNNVYFFIEFDKMIKRPKQNGTYPRGHKQKIIKYDIISGKFTSTNVGSKVKGGVTFHPNLSRVFYYKNEIYLLSEESANYSRSLYKLTGNEFKIISLNISEKFIKNQLGIKGRALDNLLDKVTGDNGGKYLFSNTSVEDNSFKYDTIKIKLGLVEDNIEARISITVNSQTVDAVQEKEVKVIDQSTYDSLPKEDYGHKKP